MDPAKEMNAIRLQMIDIARLIDDDFPHIEIKKHCPWCGKKTLLLRERDTHYWCMNPDCSREGDLDELEYYLLKKIMEERKAVRQ